MQTIVSGLLCICAASLLAPASAQAAGYDAVPVQMEIVKAPPALVAFIKKIQATANFKAKADDIASLISDETELLVGGLVPEELELKSSGKFDRNSPKLWQFGNALLQGAKPADYQIGDHALDLVSGALEADTDRQLILGRQPGNPDRLCLGPVVTADKAALIRARAHHIHGNGFDSVTTTELKIYKDYSGKSRVIATIPANRAIQMIEFDERGGRATILAPSGQTGYADAKSLVSLYSSGMCFALQANGEWLVDAIMKRRDHANRQ